MPTFNQEFKPLAIDEIHDHAAIRKASGWRYVQILAVNTEEGIDLIYTFLKDGLLENNVVSKITSDDEITSISDLYLEAFVSENETRELFGVNITDIAIDFMGNFYRLAEREPMTIISPEQQAAREKARKIAAAKAAKEAKDAKEATAAKDSGEAQEGTAKTVSFAEPNDTASDNIDAADKAAVAEKDGE